MRQILNKKDVLINGTRKRIYETIKEQPGICIRELERTVKIGIGQLTHHLPILLKTGFIKEETEGYFRRFFPSGIDESERKLLSFLRREAVRKVIPLLLSKNEITNKEISRELRINPSTTNWHIQRMKLNELIKERKEGNRVFYSLKDKHAISYIYKI